mgnify:CR=1 FL=1
MAIEQIKLGFDNFSYLIHCPETGEAALVDPGMDTAKARKFIQQNNLKLKYIINTHHHRDHTADNQRLKYVYESKIIATKKDAEAITGGIDRAVSERDELEVGSIGLKFIMTPGHTPGGMCVLVDDKFLLTGDTLFIDDCGRTDLSGGSNRDMFESLQNIKSLPDDVIIYPGHDYGPMPFDTLGNQKMTNKALLAGSVEELAMLP